MKLFGDKREKPEKEEAEKLPVPKDKTRQKRGRSSGEEIQEEYLDDEQEEETDYAEDAYDDADYAEDAYDDDDEEYDDEEYDEYDEDDDYDYDEDDDEGYDEKRMSTRKRF